MPGRTRTRAAELAPPGDGSKRADIAAAEAVGAGRPDVVLVEEVEAVRAKRANPAPAWVALFAAWGGLIMLVLAIVFVFLPGTRDPVAELQHRQNYSVADRFLPVPIYGITFSLFLGIVVLWQMRQYPRPLPAPLVAQRLQAWIGLILSILAAAIIYIDVGLRGPKS